jgi:hypothetical protein
VHTKKPGVMDRWPRPRQQSHGLRHVVQGPGLPHTCCVTQDMWLTLPGLQFPPWQCDEHSVQTSQGHCKSTRDCALPTPKTQEMPAPFCFVIRIRPHLCPLPLGWSGANQQKVTRDWWNQHQGWCQREWQAIWATALEGDRASNPHRLAPGLCPSAMLLSLPQLHQGS